MTELWQWPLTQPGWQRSCGHAMQTSISPQLHLQADHCTVFHGAIQLLGREFMAAAGIELRLLHLGNHRWLRESMIGWKCSMVFEGVQLDYYQWYVGRCSMVLDSVPLSQKHIPTSKHSQFDKGNHRFGGYIMDSGKGPSFRTQYSSALAA